MVSQTTHEALVATHTHITSIETTTNDKILSISKLFEVDSMHGKWQHCMCASCFVRQALDAHRQRRRRWRHFLRQIAWKPRNRHHTLQYVRGAYVVDAVNLRHDTHNTGIYHFALCTCVTVYAARPTKSKVEWCELQSELVCNAIYISNRSIEAYTWTWLCTCDVPSNRDMPLRKQWMNECISNTQCLVIYSL